MDLEQTRGLVESYGPIAVGIGSTLDNTGVPIFFVAGLVVAAASDAQSSATAMLAAAVVGSVVGDLGVYAIGRYFLTKERMLQGLLGQSFRPVLEAGDKAMRRWGFWSLLFGRFIPYVGKIIPFLAGSYRTPWWKAVLSVCLGSVMLMSLCYWFEEGVIAMVTEGASTIRSISSTIGILILFGLWWFNRELQQRAQMAALASADEPPEDPSAKKSRYR
jgi:membrane protein DedA with SNARE-associated domain